MISLRFFGGGFCNNKWTFTELHWGSGHCSSVWSSVRGNCECWENACLLCYHLQLMALRNPHLELNAIRLCPEEKKKVLSMAPTAWCPQQNKQANRRRATVRSFRAPPSSCVCMCIHVCLADVEGWREGERLQVRISTIEWCLTHDDLSKQHIQKITCLRVKTWVWGWSSICVQFKVRV